MQKQLADGLILRTLSEGYASDREQLPAFYGAVNGEGEPESEVIALQVWTQDLINNHPQTSHDDIFVVVDPAHEDRIVSATLLIPQEWRYEGVPISVGRPELVGTHPEYRSRGLVRQLFAEVHERSAALGHEMQVITGIPYFYRQFGYTMAVDLGDMGSLPLTSLKEPEADYTPSFSLRAATVEDIADLSAWYDVMARERLLTENRSPRQWRHELAGHSARSMRERAFLIIVDNGSGEGVGYVELSKNLYNKHLLYCSTYIVGERSSYVATFDDVTQGIRRWATETFGDCPTLLFLGSGNHDSLGALFERTLGGVTRTRTYKWYIRVPDPIAFLRKIQPVLEQRLEGSGAHRFTGELKIGFYDLTGISLQFEEGRIVDITTAKGKDGYHVAFPWYLFWNVVFGSQGIAEMHPLLPEVWTSNGKYAVLLGALFPKKKSLLVGLA